MKKSNLKLLILATVTILSFNISFAKRYLNLENKTEHKATFNIRSTQVGCCFNGCNQMLAPNQTLRFDLWRDNERGSLCLAPCINRIIAIVHEPEGDITITVDQSGQVIKESKEYIQNIVNKAAAAGGWVAKQVGDAKVEGVPLATVAKGLGYYFGGFIGAGAAIGNAIEKQCFMDSAVLKKIQRDGGYTYVVEVT